MAGAKKLEKIRLMAAGPEVCGRHGLLVVLAVLGCGGHEDTSASEVLSSNACQPLGGAVITTGENSDIQLAVSQTERGPELRHGASVFNIVASEGTRCARTFEGPCELRDCRPPMADLGDNGAALPALNLGAVTVQRTTRDAALMHTLSPRSNGSYTPDSIDGTAWQAGDEVCVRASGEGSPIGRFQMPVRFPSPLRLLSPTVLDPVNEVLPVDRSADLTVRWEPTSERVVVSLRQRPTNGVTSVWLEEVIVTCAYDGNAGAGVVPARALARFESAVEGNSSGSLAVSARRETSMIVNGHRVTASVGDGVSLRATFR